MGGGLVSERPVYFVSGDTPVFGVTTDAGNRRSDAVICSGGWHAGALKANRLVVRLARALAAEGWGTMRFDWAGAGESMGHVHSFALNEPNPENVRAAADELSSASGNPISLVGICFGARSALAAAVSLPSVDAVALVSYPLPAARAKVRRAEKIPTSAALREALRPSTIRGWWQPATRRVYLKFMKLRWQKLLTRFGITVAKQRHREEFKKSVTIDILEELRRQLDAILSRRTRALLVFGSGDALHDHWVEACRGPLRGIVERYHDLIDVVVLDGDLTGFSSLDAQAGLIDTVTRWLCDSPSPGRA